MKSAQTHKTALILIDVQNGFLHPTHWGTSRSTPDCEVNIEKLLRSARNYNKSLPAASGSKPILICHVYHHSIQSDSELHPSKYLEVNGNRISATDPQSFASPAAGESVWVKNVNSAFIGTGLEAFLRENNVRQLIICGLTTDHCVSTSTRMASNLRIVDIVNDGGEVLENGDIVLVGDACATYSKGNFDAETVHQVNLASLNEEFAHVASTKTVVENIIGN